MRLLLLSPFPPDPNAAHGGGAYLGNLCRGLAAEAELGLVTFGTPAMVAAASLPWAGTWLVPPAQRPHGAARALHQLRMAWQCAVARRPLLVAKHRSTAMTGLIRTACDLFAPTAVLVEMAVMAQYLPAFGPIPTILTDHEAGAPSQSTTGMGAFADRLDHGSWQRYVRESYPKASGLQTVTDEDAATLRELLGRPVGVRPAALSVPPHPLTLRAGPPRALFLGDYRHHPNPEAAARIVQDIWPRVLANVPDAELWFAGPNEDRLAGIRGADGVRVLGFVEDLHALIAQTRVLLAPLYSGRGFRVKHLTAMSLGLPVVTNQLGARGITAPAPACTRAESPDELAAATIALLRDPARAAASGATAHQWALANLSPAAVAKRQCDVVRELIASARPR